MATGSVPVVTSVGSTVAVGDPLVVPLLVGSLVVPVVVSGPVVIGIVVWVVESGSEVVDASTPVVDRVSALPVSADVIALESVLESAGSNGRHSFSRPGSAWAANRYPVSHSPSGKAHQPGSTHRPASPERTHWASVLQTYAGALEQAAPIATATTP